MKREEVELFVRKLDKVLTEVKEKRKKKKEAKADDKKEVDVKEVKKEVLDQEKPED